MDARNLLEPFGIVPVVVVDDDEVAVRLAEVFVEAGVGVIEVTLRTSGAMQAIEAIARRVPDMLLGAGSVRTAEQLANVAAAGASFAVSPGSSPALLEAAEVSAIPFVPGAITPSEVLGLLERGYTLQKFFPAEVAGGIPFLKSIASPIPEATFMPTGGIGPDLARDYLALPNVLAVGGSWLAPSALVAAGDFEQIATLARDAAAIAV